eukprot:CAMPEP_0194386892 /NCGR_PEP_ID=MMETSP0174-20130528/88867_1 /TAXON_ID=216777 /ORGANISM="Proboscia alata, Strain PI-D3" /LENGTH=114 /DNA_ID=CAMNT_0039176509 /DNA_START=19 /DNA_END=360 /DNA_ORIENTATION=-
MGNAPSDPAQNSDANSGELVQPVPNGSTSATIPTQENDGDKDCKSDNDNVDQNHSSETATTIAVTHTSLFSSFSVSASSSSSSLRSSIHLSDCSDDESLPSGEPSASSLPTEPS